VDVTRIFYTMLVLAAVVYGCSALEITTGSALAQTSILAVHTDKTDYTQGDFVVIYGNVTSRIVDTPIIMQIFKGGNPVYINQIIPAEDKTYWDIIKADGSRWSTEGEYLVKMRYGENYEASTKFNFTLKDNSDTGDTSSMSGNAEVDAGSETFDVPYVITGGTVTGMTLDWQDLALLVDINTTAAYGSITLELPERYIGAEKPDMTDEMFIVLIDDVETTYMEPPTPAQSLSRTIVVEFLEGDSQIEIIGTYAVPEFSHVAVVVLAVGILAMVVLYRIRAGSRGSDNRTGLLLVPSN